MEESKNALNMSYIQAKCKVSEVNVLRMQTHQIDPTKVLNALDMHAKCTNEWHTKQHLKMPDIWHIIHTNT